MGQGGTNKLKHGLVGSIVSVGGGKQTPHPSFWKMDRNNGERWGGKTHETHFSKVKKKTGEGYCLIRGKIIRQRTKGKTLITCREMEQRGLWSRRCLKSCPPEERGFYQWGEVLHSGGSEHEGKKGEGRHDLSMQKGKIFEKGHV